MYIILASDVKHTIWELYTSPDLQGLSVTLHLTPRCFCQADLSGTNTPAARLRPRAPTTAMLPPDTGPSHMLFFLTATALFPPACTNLNPSYQLKVHFLGDIFLPDTLWDTRFSGGTVRAPAFFFTELSQLWFYTYLSATWLQSNGEQEHICFTSTLYPTSGIMPSKL